MNVHAQSARVLRTYSGASIGKPANLFRGPILMIPNTDAQLCLDRLNGASMNFNHRERETSIPKSF